MDPFDELLVFRRFRMNVIQFLRLPLDVDEKTLCIAIRAASSSLMAGYECRSARASAVVRVPARDESLGRIEPETAAEAG
jgi:hypothetical protein